MAELTVDRVLVFEVGDLTCALPAEVTHEVLPSEPATRLPGAPPSVDGLVNVRGTLLTVIDAHRLLGRERLPEHEGAIVAVEVFRRRCGLRVGRVVDLLRIPAGGIAAREDLPGVEPAIVRGVGRTGGRPFIVLDLETLLRPVMGG